MKIIRPLILVLLAAGFAASVTAQPVAVTGADGVEVRVEDPSRIVTLAGSVTEIVYALGLGDQVVGADQTSLYPAEVRQKARLGSYRQASAEGILALRPSLVLSAEGFGPPPVAEQLRRAGVPVLISETPHSAEEAQARIRLLATALDREAEGEAMIAQIDEKLAEARQIQAASGRRPRVLFVYARGAGLVQVAGRETLGDAAIRLAGAENVITAYEGYRPLTAEAVVTAAPEVILVPKHGVESLGGLDAFLRQPGIALTPAGQNRRILAVDDALLLSFGPRLGEGVLALSQLLHDDEAAPNTSR